MRDEAQKLTRVRSAPLEFGAPDSVLQELERAEPLDVLWRGLPPARIDFMKGATASRGPTQVSQSARVPPLLREAGRRSLGPVLAVLHPGC